MSSILLVVGPPNVGKSSIIDALTYGAFHREYYPQDIQFQVKLAKVASHRVYEVQAIEWDGKPMGLVQYYSSLANLIMIVVDICGEYEQLNQVEELYEFLDCEKQMVLIANLNGKQCRNEKLSNALSLFAKMNRIKLYELDSRDILSVQLEFQYITESQNLVQEILTANQTLVHKFLQCTIQTIKQLNS